MWHPLLTECRLLNGDLLETVFSPWPWLGIKIRMGEGDPVRRPSKDNLREEGRLYSIPQLTLHGWGRPLHPHRIHPDCHLQLTQSAHLKHSCILQGYIQRLILSKQPFSHWLGSLGDKEKNMSSDQYKVPGCVWIIRWCPARGIWSMW